MENRVSNKNILNIVFRHLHASYMKKCNQQYNRHFLLNEHIESNKIYGLQYINPKSNGYLEQYFNFRVLEYNNWKGYRYICNISMKKYQGFVAYLPNNYF